MISVILHGGGKCFKLNVTDDLTAKFCFLKKLHVECVTYYYEECVYSTTVKLLDENQGF